MDHIEQIAILVNEEIKQYSKNELLHESTKEPKAMNKPVVKKSKITENQNPEMVVLRLKKKIEILESKKAKVLKENTIKTIQNSLSKALGKDCFDWETVEELSGDLEGFTFTAGKALTPEQKTAVKDAFGNKHGDAKVTGTKTVKVIVAKKAENLREGSAPTVRIEPDPDSEFWVDIIEHPMFGNGTDYSYLAGKGYSDEEILAFWDRDLRGGSKPVNWKVGPSYGQETKVVEPSLPAISGPTTIPMESAVKVRFKTLVEMAANSAKKGRTKIAAGYLKEANDIAVKMGYKDWTAVVKVKKLKEGFVNDDPTREEMSGFIDSMGGEFDDFDKEEAMYWFATDFHGGQGSNLYSVLSTSEYSPGMATNGPSDNFLYDALVDEFAPSVVSESTKLKEGFKEIVDYIKKVGKTAAKMWTDEDEEDLTKKVYAKYKELRKQDPKLTATAATKKACALVCESKKNSKVKEGVVGGGSKSIGGVLNEGTWSSPSSVQSAQELAALMAKPIPFRLATDMIYEYVGDDELFDDLDYWADKNPNGDARSVILSKIEEWLGSGEQNGFANWNSVWEPEAIAILKGLIAKYGWNAQYGWNSPRIAEGRDFPTYTAFDKPQHDSSDAVYDAVMGRIVRREVGLVTLYGMQQIENAVRDISYGVGEVEEIGSSDVSCWVNDVRDYLERNCVIEEGTTNTKNKRKK